MRLQGGGAPEGRPYRVPILGEGRTETDMAMCQQCEDLFGGEVEHREKEVFVPQTKQHRLWQKVFHRIDRDANGTISQA